MAEYEAQQERRRMLSQQDTPEMAREVHEEGDMSLDERDKQDTPTNVPGTPTNPGSTPTKRAGKRKLTALNPTSPPGDPANTLMNAVSSPTDPSAAFTPMNRATIAPQPASRLSNSNITTQTRERIDRDNDYLYDLRNRWKFPWPQIIISAKEDRGLDLSILDAQQRVSQAVDRYRRGRPTAQFNLVQQDVTPSTPVDSDENDEFFLYLKDRLNLTPCEIVARAHQKGLGLRASDVAARISRARNRLGQPKPQFDPLAKHRDGASGAAFSNPIDVDSFGSRQSSMPPSARPPTQSLASAAVPAPRDPTHSPAQSRAPAPFLAPPLPQNPGPHPMNMPPAPTPAAPRDPGPNTMSPSQATPAPPLRDPGPHPFTLPPDPNAPPRPTITAIVRELGITLHPDNAWLVQMHEGHGLSFTQIDEMLPPSRRTELGGLTHYRMYQQTFQNVRDNRLVRLRDGETLSWEQIARSFEAEQGTPVSAEHMARRYQRLREMWGGGGQ